jgi:hypothetical protein
MYVCFSILACLRQVYFEKNNKFMIYNKPVYSGISSLHGHLSIKDAKVQS